MNRFIMWLALWSAIALNAQAQERIRVACVGDSITFGSGVQGRETNSYPAVLQHFLGTKFEVKNFGVSGATLLKKGDKPYWKERAFTSATAFQPNVVVIKLGTNDSKPQNRTNIADFAGDLAAMVEHFAALKSKPRIYLCLPVPVYKTQWGINEESVVSEIIPAIKKVASDKKLPTIDLHSALADKKELFPDNIHPNAAGAKLMAEEIFAAIK
jgi:lysophospholipase L1-like esterase